MSTVTAISFKPKATRKRLKKEILSDDFKKRKIFWKNFAENFWKIFYGKFSTSHHYIRNGHEATAGYASMYFLNFLQQVTPNGGRTTEVGATLAPVNF
jgi:hypothetical protein